MVYTWCSSCLSRSQAVAWKATCDDATMIQMTPWFFLWFLMFGAILHIASLLELQLIKTHSPFETTRRRLLRLLRTDSGSAVAASLQVPRMWMGTVELQSGRVENCTAVHQQRYVRHVQGSFLALSFLPMKPYATKISQDYGRLQISRNSNSQNEALLGSCCRLLPPQLVPRTLCCRDWLWRGPPSRCNPPLDQIKSK